MADETFNGLITAVAVQSSGFGTPDATVAALDHTTATDLADGFVLGDAESGDAESGITIPNIVGVYRAVAQVPGSFTQQADAFQKANVTGFSIAWVMQGNGATASDPISSVAGEAGIATIIPGMDAILKSAGLSPANGTAPVVAYTPAASTTYTTWKLWHGDLAFVFSDCLVEKLTFTFTPAQSVIATANIAVGTFDSTTSVDGFTFPTIDFEEMAALTGPVVEGVAFSAFGQTRGFQDLSIEIANEVQLFGDSNVDVSGQRQTQTKRVVTVNGTLYSATAQSDAEFLNLVNTSAPTADLSFQVGDVTVANGTYNSFKLEANNLQATDIKYNRIGTAMSCELNGAKATATTAGGEFTLTFN